MTKLEKIQQKVKLPYSLKHYFASGSDESSRLDYPQKMELLRSVVQNGFSTYDLTEAFREPHSSHYTHDDMQKELVSYIGYELYREPFHLIVAKYYEDMSDKEVATDLDAFLLSDDSFGDFKRKFKEKFDVELPAS